MIRPDTELELTTSDMEEMVGRALAHITQHLASLSQQPSSYARDGAQLAKSLVEPLPDQGMPLEDLLKLIFEEVVPASFNTAGPGYLGYIPGGGLFQAAVADLISDAVNRYTGVWVAAPGLVQLEVNVLRWLCDVMGYPPQALGILTSGGSMANFSAIVAARRTHLPEDFSKGTIYVSDQTHHSVQKSALIAGFPPRNVRGVRSNADFTVCLKDLQAQMDRDRRDGWAPFLLVGNAGTTNTGTVDDLKALADIAQAQGIWFHVDGAYGGCFMLTEHGRRVMHGIERADSITLDPHKGLFLPYGTGALLVKDRLTLKRAFSLTNHYMPDLQTDPDLVDFCELSPELSRGFRGLRLWLPIKRHGIGPFRRNLEEKLGLARWAAQALGKVQGIELLAAPQLSVVAFRYAKPGLSEEALDQLNRQLLERINLRGRVFLTGTVLRGRFAIRICILSFRTHLDRVQQAVEDIQAAMNDLA